MPLHPVKNMPIALKAQTWRYFDNFNKIIFLEIWISDISVSLACIETTIISVLAWNFRIDGRPLSFVISLNSRMKRFNH